MSALISLSGCVGMCGSVHAGVLAPRIGGESYSYGKIRMPGPSGI